MRSLAVAILLAGCGGKLPETRYYQLSAAGAPTTSSPAMTIVLEPFTTEASYDDERIVYRTNPYRLDYYQYHRWSAPPGVLVSNFFEEALEQTGKFAVVRELEEGAPVVLAGRVIALEEVDTSPRLWTGRIVLELRLADAKSGAIVWSAQFEEREPLPKQSPEGLARALSTALGRIASKAAPLIDARAAEAIARHAGAPPPMAKQAP